jgi:hypothetical protein
MKYSIFSLTELMELDARVGTNKVKTMIEQFSCPHDIDINNFVKEHSVLYEERNLARTHFVIEDESKKMVGFFSLSINLLKLGEEISQSTVRKISGFNDKKEIPGVLIGQLSKNYYFKDNSIDGKTLLDLAFGQISQINRIASVRLIYLESKIINKLSNFYLKYGFKIISDSNNNPIVKVSKHNNRLLTYWFSTTKFKSSFENI